MIVGYVIALVNGGNSDSEKAKAKLIRTFSLNVTFPGDLTLMEQYIQEGLRNLFETVIFVKNSKAKISIPKEKMIMMDSIIYPTKLLCKNKNFPGGKLSTY